jgi:hypothetical protein
LLLKYRSALESEKRLHFDQPSLLTDTDYYNLTGLTIQQFNKLISFISNSNIIHQSAKRSVRTTIGLLLCKLRLGLSNRVLSSLFQVNKMTVSRAIHRDTIIKNHTTTIAKELIGGGKDVAILVADGTYLYIQVSFSNSNSFRVFFLYVLF